MVSKPSLKFKNHYQSNSSSVIDPTLCKVKTPALFTKRSTSPISLMVLSVSFQLLTSRHTASTSGT